MYFPTWIDLKGEDSVPETVHHVVLMVDPHKDTLWKTAARHIATDEVHAKDCLNPNVETPGAYRLFCSSNERLHSINYVNVYAARH
jgi:hypothetical protein